MTVFPVTVQVNELTAIELTVAELQVAFAGTVKLDEKVIDTVPLAGT